ncbi:hypothetical protein D3C75_1268360 [compost metagenome]
MLIPYLDVLMLRYLLCQSAYNLVSGSIPISMQDAAVAVRTFLGERDHAVFLIKKCA